MEKQRSIKILSVVALIVAVLGLTVAFAALSETLNITGVASVEGGTDAEGNKDWDIKFVESYDENGEVKEPTSTGSAKANSVPVLTENSFDFDVSFSKPGDSVTAYFKIANKGTINAYISSLEKGTVTCSPKEGSSATQEEANAVCKDIKFSFTYSDGEDVSTGDDFNGGVEKDVIVHVEYLNTTENQELPSGDITINGLSVVTNFADKQFKN